MRRSASTILLHLFKGGVAAFDGDSGRVVGVSGLPGADDDRRAGRSRPLACPPATESL